MTAIDKSKKVKQIVAKSTQTSKPSNLAVKRKAAVGKTMDTAEVAPKKKVRGATAASTITADVENASTSAHPFVWDPADDCETSFYAYRDIAPFLSKLAQRLKKSKSELAIYDPYYCKGTLIKHLKKLGFTNVYNKDEDFYARLDAGKLSVQLPLHDVLVTSPPYSKNHIERLAHHLRTTSAPWMVLMPSYVHRKQYYASLVDARSPCFLVPNKPYVYYAVNGGRSSNTDVLCRHWVRDGSCPKGSTCSFKHSENASDNLATDRNPVGNGEAPTPVIPFHSFWHISLGRQWQSGIVQAWNQKFKKNSKCQMVPSIESLPNALVACVTKGS